LVATELPVTTVRGACAHDCPDGCAWIVTVQGGRAVKLRGDPAHPFTRGGLCAKVDRFLEDRVYHPDRILYPLRRTGPKGSGLFERVTWDAALDAISAKVRDVVAIDGPTAVLPLRYFGAMGYLQGGSIADRLFARLGATRMLWELCGTNGGEGVEMTMGDGPTMIPDDLRHSRYIVLWGTNTLTTNLHLWPFIREAKQRNHATVVVVDPIKTRTAAAADRHIRPMPGTDAALALGMMHVIVAEGLHDAAYVDSYTLGFDELRERLEAFPPARVAKVTGLREDEIVTFARDYATTRPGAIRVLVGMEHGWNGGMSFRAVACLPALVGAWRDLGGGLATMTGDWLEGIDEDLGFPCQEDESIRAMTIAQFGRSLTDASMKPPIRALFIWNSNPAVTMPNQNLVRQGLGREDLFTVVVEHTMTDTAMLADYVLPATTQLEHWDVNFGWGHTYLHLNVPAIAPVGEALPNTEIFRRLAARLGFREPMFRQTDEEMARAAVTTGHPSLSGLTFEELIERGWIDLRTHGDFLPYADGGFKTPSGKVEFYSQRMAERGLDPLPAFQPAEEGPRGDRDLVARYPLMLMTPKSAHHFLNSSYGNIKRQLKAEREPVLDIHPEDAESRSIADGDVIRVFNGRGSLQLRARVGDKVRPGVVAVPSGWWASQSPGGRSVNALTPDGLVDLRGAGAFHGALVEVERA
jgi:anaerobic selenocysteine-containing dehydrogenase